MLGPESLLNHIAHLPMIEEVTIKHTHYFWGLDRMALVWIVHIIQSIQALHTLRQITLDFTDVSNDILLGRSVFLDTLLTSPTIEHLRRFSTLR